MIRFPFFSSNSPSLQCHANSDNHTLGLRTKLILSLFFRNWTVTIMDCWFILNVLLVITDMFPKMNVLSLVLNPHIHSLSLYIIFTMMSSPKFPRTNHTYKQSIMVTVQFLKKRLRISFVRNPNVWLSELAWHWRLELLLLKKGKRIIRKYISHSYM
jgi:hypothetical protein